jgi:NTE family protein
VAEPFLPPDVLVLASGGALGEAWMSGVLAGIEDATGHDFRATESLVGTSAGALVAAALVAGERPRRPPRASGLPALGAGTPADDIAAESGGAVAAARTVPRAVLSSIAREALRLAGAAATPLAPMALAVGSSGSTAVRSALLGLAPGADRSLAAIGEGIRASGARFDGRLRVVAVDRARGRRVVFGAPGAPAAAVAEAVQASCSVPWVFAPVTIDGREYVDGGVWSNTNLDVAPVGRLTQVLCLNPIASLDLAMASPLRMLRALAGSTAAVEALALRNRGARVRMLGPSADVARVMGPDLSDTRLRDDVLAGGYAQGLEIGGAG